MNVSLIFFADLQAFWIKIYPLKNLNHKLDKTKDFNWSLMPTQIKSALDLFLTASKDLWQLLETKMNIPWPKNMDSSWELVKKIMFHFLPLGLKQMKISGPLKSVQGKESAISRMNTHWNFIRSILRPIALLSVLLNMPENKWNQNVLLGTIQVCKNWKQDSWTENCLYILTFHFYSFHWRSQNVWSLGNNGVY